MSIPREYINDLAKELTEELAKKLDRKVREKYPERDPNTITFAEFVGAIEGEQAGDKVKEESGKGMTYAEMRARYG